MLLIFLTLLLPLAANSVFVCPNSLVTLNLFKVPEDVVMPGTKCTFSLLYPPASLFNSTFALVYVTTSNANADDSFQLTDTYGTTVDMTWVAFPFTVPPPRLTINITAGPNSRMKIGMMISLQKSMPFNVRQEMYTVGTNAPAQFIELRKMAAPKYNVIQSTGNGVYLSVAAPVGPASSNPALLMNAFVYDGINAGANLLGTLYTVYTNGPLISTKGAFTIYSASGIDYDGLVMVTDQSNVEQYNSYYVLWADFDTDPVQGITMSAKNGPTAMTILSKLDYSNPIYMTGLKLDSNQTVFKGYAQTPLANKSSMPVLIEYPNNNAILPQLFDSYARTFVLESGQAFLEYTTNKALSKDSVAFNSRIGFVATQDYGISSENLKSSEQFLQADFRFSVTFLAHLTAPDTTVGVRNYDTSETQFFDITPQNMNTVTVEGRNLSIFISNKRPGTSNGTLIYYVIIKKGDATELPTNPPENGGGTPTPLPETESTTNGVLTISYGASLLFAVCRFLW